MMKTALTLIAVICLVMSAAGIAAASGGGDLTFKAENAKTVTFSHDQHVNIKALKCSACHNHTFQMSKGSDKMDMKKINKGQFCGRCHNGVHAFDVNDKASCARCHK
jgi:c(7)-type cytochrome triheme protein